MRRNVEDLISHGRKEIKRTSAVIRSDVAYMGGGERGKTSEEESRTKEEENVVGGKVKAVASERLIPHLQVDDER